MWPNDLSEKEKKAIAKAARDALYEENWKKVLGLGASGALEQSEIA